MSAHVNIDSSIQKTLERIKSFPMSYWVWNYNNQVVMHSPPASVLVTVSDRMDAYHVHLQSARHADAHVLFIFAVLSCGFKWANASTTSWSSLLTIYLFWAMVQQNQSLLTTAQCISYIFIHWMLIPRELFWINPCNCSGILLIFTINEYDIHTLHICVVCHHNLSID